MVAVSMCQACINRLKPSHNYTLTSAAVFKNFTICPQIEFMYILVIPFSQSTHYVEKKL